MVVLAVGVLAVFAMFQSSLVQIRRAANVSTAAALADTEMERFRAVKYSVIGLDDAHVAAADSIYTGHAAYRADTAPATTLAATTSATATSITVASAAGFPSAAPYYVKVGSEIMLVEDGAGTTTWTVKRGQQNTVAAAQAAGASVVQKQRVHLNACGTAPCTTTTPTRTATGADGKSYRIDTYMTWDTPVNTGGTTGRNTKLVTLVVRDATIPSKVYARVSSSFDESTGL
jgi:Tfp pilus assembly protein PilV